MQRTHVYIRDLNTLIGFVYPKTGTDSKEENAHHLRCISIDVVVMVTKREIFFLADMNAHLEEFAGYTDSTGRMVQQFCDALDLVLVNVQAKCDGKNNMRKKQFALNN